jgi:predicted Zn-dependent protease with MMP-like domain
MRCGAALAAHRRRASRARVYAWSVAVTRERFEELVVEALDGLPAWVREAMDNVEVLVEDLPPADQRDLLGVYHGVPLTDRGANYTWVAPDTITLFRATIMAVAGHDEDRVREQVRRTVVHEIAHHFGIDDHRLHDLDAY